MIHPKDLQIKDFTYELPAERIAHYPLAERDQSKLLVYRKGNIVEDTYKNISNYIPSGSLLVFNNTKVIPARLFFKTTTGAKVEVFCLEPAEQTDLVAVMSSRGSVRWNCMIGRASKWKEKVLHHTTDTFTLSAELVNRISDAFVVEFTWQPATLTFAEILDKTGMMPIPPYLKRDSEEIDLARYQTVYAKYEGSVAAPTAGLHFTDAVFNALQAKNISRAEVTLHVGAGTFKPVKSETMQGHEMHAEVIDVAIETLQQIKAALSKINTTAEDATQLIAVGTTSLRTIETLYWMGVKAKLNPGYNIDELEIKQWDVYEPALQINLTATESMQELIIWAQRNDIQRIVCKTQIMIAPSYKLKLATALVTNFHQPDSTLLLLVAAVVGDNWRDIYSYAMEHDFRFLSYGDGSLLFA